MSQATNEVGRSTARRPLFHKFIEDPQSGAGNCMCGAGKFEPKHPHNFVKAELGAECICSLPKWAQVHDAKEQGEVPVPLKYKMEVSK